MLRRGLTKLTIVAAAIVLWGQVASAQTEQRTGIISYRQAQELTQSSITLSHGSLAQLQTDPNFNGDFQTIFNDASNILGGYTIVNRGGYFPENAGIPRNQQLPRTDAVYKLYSLANGTELLLFRTPQENTSQYLIRRVTSSLTAPGSGMR